MPRSFLTSWPPGNRELRISSSVTAAPPYPVGNANERIGRQSRDRLGVGDALGLPYLDGIVAVTEPIQSVFEARLFGLERGEGEPPGRGKQLQRRGAKRLHGVIDKQFSAAQQPAMLAAHRSPHQRAVTRIE